MELELELQLKRAATRARVSSLQLESTLPHGKWTRHCKNIIMISAAAEREGNSERERGGKGELQRGRGGPKGN